MKTGYPITLDSPWKKGYVPNPCPRFLRPADLPLLSQSPVNTDLRSVNVPNRKPREMQKCFQSNQENSEKYFLFSPAKLSFTSNFHYTEMAGPRKEFEADLNPSHYALQDCFYAKFRFDTLPLSYFNFKISCQK